MTIRNNSGFFSTGCAADCEFNREYCLRHHHLRISGGRFSTRARYSVGRLCLRASVCVLVQHTKHTVARNENHSIHRILSVPEPLSKAFQSERVTVSQTKKGIWVRACKIYPKVKKKKKEKVEECAGEPTVSGFWLASNCLSALFPLLFCNSRIFFYSYKKIKNTPLIPRWNTCKKCIDLFSTKL